MHRITRQIPNFITCLNLFCGCMAVVFALRGWLAFAVAMVMVAALFDLLDGLAARLLKATSPLGKELDSLADVVSFGLVPATILHYEYCLILSPRLSYGFDSISWEVLTFFPFIVAVAAALRLAKFNIDTRQSEHFRGLPTPAAALLTCSLIVYITRTPKWMPLLDTPYSIPVVALLVSLLMVSGIPMLSLKIKALQWRGNRARLLFLGCAILIVLSAIILSWHWSLMVLLVLLSYLALSVFVQNPKTCLET
jgi:CDP-diacylglycerol--serine O-phosphatidyltransferase